MKMSDFLALEVLPPHNGLRSKGVVVPLASLQAANPAGSITINFVSHQWLGSKEADPQVVWCLYGSQTMTSQCNRYVTQ